MIIALIIVSALLLLSIAMNVIQLLRQENFQQYINDLEQSNVEYFEFFKTLRSRVHESNYKLRNLDRRGAFESDDEVGFIFSEMKQIIDDLDRSF
jgi:hypothetical protein